MTACATCAQPTTYRDPGRVHEVVPSASLKKKNEPGYEADSLRTHPSGSALCAEVGSAFAARGGSALRAEARAAVAAAGSSLAAGSTHEDWPVMLLKK